MCLVILSIGKQAFYTIKTSIIKVEKIAFLQRGQSIVLVKNLKFFQVFILAKQERKRCWSIFFTGKKSFQTKKITFKYVKKYCIFPKRLVRGFRQKFEIFQSFYFIKKKARKMCFTIFSIEKQSFQTIKILILKCRKIAVFQRVQSMVFVKNLRFFHIFIL